MTMELEMINLQIDDWKEDAKEVNVEEEECGLNDGFCLVGHFLTTSVVQFQVMRNKLENLWHPFGGVAILDLTEKRYQFQFFTKLTLIE